MFYMGVSHNNQELGIPEKHSRGHQKCYRVIYLADIPGYSSHLDSVSFVNIFQATLLFKDPELIILLSKLISPLNQSNWQGFPQILLRNLV